MAINPSSHPLPSPDLLTSRQVANRLAVSVRTLYRMVKAGNFPQPIRYNRKLIRWKSADVSQYLQALVSSPLPPVR